MGSTVCFKGICFFRWSRGVTISGDFDKKDLSCSTSSHTHTTLSSNIRSQPIYALHAWRTAMHLSSTSTSNESKLKGHGEIITGMNSLAGCSLVISVWRIPDWDTWQIQIRLRPSPRVLQSQAFAICIERLFPHIGGGDRLLQHPLSIGHALHASSWQR